MGCRSCLRYEERICKYINYMIKKVKLFSIDLDGTLFKSNGTISSDAIGYINKCKELGYYIVYNTARPLKMIQQAFYKQFVDDYWVFSNGTTCFKSGKMIFHDAMYIMHITELLEKLHNDFPMYFFSVESHGEIYTTSSCEITNKKYYAEYEALNSIKGRDINKIIIIAENRDFPIHEITSLIHVETKLLVTENGKYVQIMPVKSSKLSAIERIIAQLGFELSNVLAFGDDLNDLELIQACGFGVAMGNADNRIKECANYITVSNDDDGVSHFFGKTFFTRNLS